MSLIKNFYHDLICEQQNPEYDQYNYDVLAEEEYFRNKAEAERLKLEEEAYYQQLDYEYMVKMQNNA